MPHEVDPHVGADHRASRLRSAVDASDHVPLNKDSTGEGVRPIALGEALLKLAEAVAVDESAVQLRAYLEPAQVAMRTPGGAELVAHLIRT